MVTCRPGQILTVSPGGSSSFTRITFHTWRYTRYVDTVVVVFASNTEEDSDVRSPRVPKPLNLLDVAVNMVANASASIQTAIV